MNAIRPFAHPAHLDLSRYGISAGLVRSTRRSLQIHELTANRTQVRGHHPLDRLPNFGAAGYGVLPDWQPPTKQLYPYADARDTTADLQRALDAGGIIDLADGVYPLHGQLRFTTSHTILRGTRNAILDIKGPPRTVLIVGLDDPGRPKLANRVKIIDDYAPVGADRLRVDNARAVRPGARVYVERKATAEWIRQLGMDKLVRNGQPQTWIKPGTTLKAPREIVKVEGDTVFFDIPLTDSLDARWGPGELVTYSPPAQTTEIGLANLTIRLVPSRSGDNIATAPSFLAIQVQPYAEAVWVRNVATEGFLASIIIEAHTSRITVQDSIFRRTAPTDRTRGWPMDVTLKGTRALVLRCMTEATVAGANAFAVGTQSMNSGPNAVVEYVAKDGWMAPHQRWATGVLFEGCQVDKVELANRGSAGSGQGWSIGSGA